MTYNFDIFVRKTLKECGMTIDAVTGISGSYDSSDVRTATVLGPMQRRNKRGKRKKKK